MLPRPALASAAAAAALLAAPAFAHADPSMILDSGCYVQSESTGDAQTIASKIDGLAPQQSVALRITRQGDPIGQGDPLAADASGSLVNDITAWSTDLGTGPQPSVPAVVEAFDPVLGTTIASAPTQIANFDYSVTTSGSKHHWTIQGLTALTGSNVYYAHYFNHGKYKGRMKLGKASGPCGFLKITTTHLTPFKKIGRYDVAIEASKKYDDKAPKFTGRVTVTTKYY
jgi:hypothetical protein